MNKYRAYEITDDTKLLPNGQKVNRIRALVDIPHHGVHAGDIGGYVMSYNNLLEMAWVADDATVHGSSVVRGFASVTGEADVCDGSIISRMACVRGSAKVINSLVTDSATVGGDAYIESSCVKGNAYVLSGAHIFPGVTVTGDAYVTDIDIHSSDEVINVFLGGQSVTITPRYIHIFGHIILGVTNIIKVINNDFKSQFTTKDFEWCERWLGAVIALQQAMLMPRDTDQCRHNN